MPPPHDERGALPGIQYLRGFAAILVVAFHAAANAEPSNATGLLAYGYLGVDLFFVISGFIITYVTLDPQTTMPRSSVAAFAKRRLLRIVPFMWVCIAGYAALRFFGRSSDLSFLPYLRAFVLWPVGELRPSVIWTLRHEALFYGVYALTFLWRPGLRWLFVIWALSPILLDAVRPIGRVEPEQDLIEFLINPVNIQFGFGVMLGLVYGRARRPPGHIAARLGGRAGFAILAGLAFCFMIAGQALSLEIMTVRTAVIAGCLASILLAIGIIMPSHGNAERDWIVGGGRLVGDASYAIYLTHLPVLLALLPLMRRVVPQMSTGPTVMIVLLAATSVGVLAHLWVEKPLLHRLKPRG